MIVFWLGLGCVVVVLKSWIGSVLAVSWLWNGCGMVVAWLCVGCVLVAFWLWLCFGSVMVLSWYKTARIYDTSRLCWGIHIAQILRRGGHPSRPEYQVIVFLCARRQFGSAKLGLGATRYA